MKSKHISSEMQIFLFEESKKKNLKPKELKEKVEIKFNTNIDYRTIANAHYLTTSQLFGNNTQDADSMKNLILLLKSKFPDFLGKILKDNINNQLKAIIYATPQMKALAEKFMDLLVMDTTFGTNRFRMKHWTMCGKNENNRTIIFAEALIVQETTEQFTWLLNTAKNYFRKEPKFILIDADPALISAVGEVFPNTNLKLCGWHTENNIKNHLYGAKKSKRLFISILII